MTVEFKYNEKKVFSFILTCNRYTTTYAYVQWEGLKTICHTIECRRPLTLATMTAPAQTQLYSPCVRY